MPYYQQHIECMTAYQSQQQQQKQHVGKIDGLFAGLCPALLGQGDGEQIWGSHSLRRRPLLILTEQLSIRAV